MKKLHKYLSLTSALTGVSSLNAAVVYTDLDPDINLTNNNTSFEIDFNGDGVAEYEVNYDVYRIFGGNGPLIYAPKISGKFGNKIGAYYLNGGGWGNPMLPEYFIFPYYSNSYVDQNANWNAANALFGYYFYNDWNYASQSLGAWDGTNDRFAILRFTLNGNTHYGWARFDVFTQYKGLIIKDFAYNDTPNESIKTGQKYDPKLVADSVFAKDVENFNNGLDLSVSFKKAKDEIGIKEYRILVVKEEDADNFSVSKANKSSNYTKVEPTGNDIATVLKEFSKDVDGDFITNNVNYKVFILSVPDLEKTFNSNLSEPSNTVVLDNNVSVENSIFTNIKYFIDEQNLILKSNISIDKVEILNLNGQTLHTVNNATQSVITLPTKGMYILRVELNNKIATKKIII